MNLPYLDLVFDIPANQVFTYRAGPAEGKNTEEAVPGKRAMAPFGRREALGYIIGRRDAPPPGVTEGALKALRRVVDKEPIFDEQDLELARWIAGYYFCGLGQALAAMIPSGKRTGSYPSISGIEEIAEKPLELSGAQQRALAAITEAPAKDAPLFYLYGITGSGKTEVFLRAAEFILNRG